MRQVKQHATITYTEPKRIDCLDSVRGLACLVVLLEHTQGAFEWPASLVSWTRYPFLNILFDGRSAVTMFFVLSGFVLAHPYLAPPESGLEPRTLSIPTFYLRRIFRIWIPWFFAFILSIFAKTYLIKGYQTTPAPSEWVSHFWRIPLTIADFFKQCTFMLHDAERLLLPQDWSLGVELKGSALIPIFLLFARRSTLALVAVIAVCLIFFHNGHYYLSFGIGVIAAKNHWHYGATLRTLSRPNKYGLLAIGLSLYQTRLFAGHFSTNIDLIEKSVWSIASVGCVLILASTLGSRRIQNHLNHPTILFVGKVSYSIYLLQFIIVLCFLPAFVHFLNALGVQASWLLWPSVIGMSTSVTIALSMAMYRFIELPSIDFGRWLTRQIQTHSSKHFTV